MAKKYYVVWQGREPGVYAEWAECKAQVDRFPGAKYKSFATLEEAESALRGGVSLKISESAASSAKKKQSAAKSNKLSDTDIAAMSFDTKIYTDGGCDPNPGRAGSGLAVYRDGEVAALWYGLFEPAGTNNTAELNALNQALIIAHDERKGDRSVAIFCDSKYAIKCITVWAFGWRTRGWKKATGEIKNLELIKEMFARYEALPTGVQIFHVNGHVGIEGNELADRMSILAIETETKPLSQFTDPIDVPSILSMKAG
ncbi:MAG: ribonuclease H family protein [Gammaproteobacteria bacterium]